MLRWFMWVLERKEILALLLELVKSLEDKNITRAELDRILDRTRDLLDILKVRS